MADDIKVPDESAGSGPAVATDEIAGRHYQISKLAFGAEDAATLVDPTHGFPVDPKTLPPGASTETTLAALKNVADTIATAAAAIQAAAEALNGKTTAVNTGAIAGTVALDAAALAALAAAATPGTQPISGNVGVLGAVEIVNDAGNPIPVSGSLDTGLDQPLTDAQLRATDVPVTGPLTDTELRASAIPISAAALPLPADAASETTLAAVNGKLPALSGGRIPVELPAGGGSLTDAELRAQPLEIDLVLVVRQLLEAIANPTHVDPSTAAMRVQFTSAQAVTVSSGTVTTVTTCATVTNLAQVGGVNAASLVADIADTSWAECVRERYAVTA